MKPTLAGPPQYLGKDVNVIRVPRVEASGSYAQGPVPTGCCAMVPAAIAFGLAIGVARVDSVVSSDGVGSDRFSRTVCSSTASIDSMTFSGPAYGPLLFWIVSRLTLTASALNAVPSWKTTPWRSSSVSASSVCSHSVASTGEISPCRSSATRFS